MSILVDENTRVVIQGLGSAGKFHTRTMLEYGTKVVAAVHPGRGGQVWEGIPIFDTLGAAVRECEPTASCIFVPAAGAADAICEAADEGLELAVCITEGIPVLDMLKVKRFLDGKSTRLIGPNCPGVITPGKCKVGIMPGPIHAPGGVGVISRSGTLTYEAVDQISRLGMGQSTCVGIGGDPVKGLDFVDLLEMFERDPGTETVMMIGEIGGEAEERAAEWIKENFSKPVVAFIAGMTAPPGKRMGHAGAIISGGSGRAEDKVAALRAAGVEVCNSPAEIGATVKKVLSSRKGG